MLRRRNSCQAHPLLAFSVPELSRAKQVSCDARLLRSTGQSFNAVSAPMLHVAQSLPHPGSPPTLIPLNFVLLPLMLPKKLL